ncbi:hypothetical protein MTO96_049533 [Rhipicephalus appendiculatus]
MIADFVLEQQDSSVPACAFDDHRVWGETTGGWIGDDRGDSTSSPNKLTQTRVAPGKNHVCECHGLGWETRGSPTWAHTQPQALFRFVLTRRACDESH